MIGALKRLTASDDSVVFVQDNHFRFPADDFGFLDGGKAHDRQTISGLAQMCRGAVQDDRAAAGFARNRVGFKPFAVAHIATEHALIGQQAHLVHQCAVHREAALVIDIRIGHRCTVDFGFE